LHGGQAEMDELGGLSLKTTRQADFPVWASKSGVHPVPPDGEVEGSWRHREACVEVKQSREGGMLFRCFYKKLDLFALAWAGSVFISIGYFCLLPEILYR